jgi:hypothetical protein
MKNIIWILSIAQPILTVAKLEAQITQEGPLIAMKSEQEDMHSLTSGSWMQSTQATISLGLKHSKDFKRMDLLLLLFHLG